MKKTFTLFLTGAILSLTSCKNELCYDCYKASNQSKFCLPRKDAKDKRDNLKSQGYTCNEFSQ